MKLVFNPKPFVYKGTHKARTVLLRLGASLQITVLCTSEWLDCIRLAWLNVIRVQAALGLGDAHYVFSQSISSLGLVISMTHLSFSLDFIQFIDWLEGWRQNRSFSKLISHWLKKVPNITVMPWDRLPWDR